MKVQEDWRYCSHCELPGLRPGCSDCGHPANNHQGQAGISCDAPACECPGLVIMCVFCLKEDRGEE
jgi:hypothetical protein